MGTAECGFFTTRDPVHITIAIQPIIPIKIFVRAALNESN